MDIFKEVKARADILKVCDILGIKLDRNHKTLCPFHKERTPSFSVLPSKNIFCCFGCDKKGDSITLVSELLNISNLEAAIYINDSLGLGIETNMNKKRTKEEKRKYDAALNKYKKTREIKEEFQKWENETFQLLCDYLHLLWRNIEEKKPKNISDEFDDLYIEALQEIDKIEYYIDEIFINGKLEDKNWFKNTNGKVVEEIGRRME